MVKIVALLRRLDGLSREEFLRRWQVDHPPYVRELPNLRRYVQNPALDHRTPWPYDGAAELWFDSVADVAAAFDGPAATALHEHERSFIGHLDWFLCEEHDIELDR